MELRQIVNISGKPGLFQVISASRTGFIVEALETRQRLPVSASAKVAALQDISIYTQEDAIALSEVFRRMKADEANIPVVDKATSDAAVKQAFQTIVPDYDTERVYVSDMRKVFRWFQILNPLLDLSIVPEEKDAAAAEETAAE
jgi:hypothetical protein